jgi:hypothetical protein
VIGSAFALGQPKLCRRDDVSVVAIGPTADDADSAARPTGPTRNTGSSWSVGLRSSALCASDFS